MLVNKKVITRKKRTNKKISPFIKELISDYKDYIEIKYKS